jgi:hypothetical protein
MEATELSWARATNGRRRSQTQTVELKRECWGADFRFFIESGCRTEEVAFAGKGCRMALCENRCCYEGKRTFRKNTSHLQQSLFGITEQLPQAKLKKLQGSKEYAFYREVFCRIKEEDFACLYSDISSRPNAPVNCLVASILLMYGHNWTTEDLFNRIDFDLLTRTALGLETLDETPFCPATFFNFQNRLLGKYRYHILRGVAIRRKILYCPYACRYFARAA